MDKRAVCACGCGGIVNTGKTWMPGHDRRALDRVWKDLGYPSIEAFVDAHAKGNVIRRRGT